MVRNKKLTKAQQRNRNVRGLVLDALFELDEAGIDLLTSNGVFDDLVDAYCEDTCARDAANDVALTREDLSERAVSRLIRDRGVQLCLNGIIRSIAYGLRDRMPRVRAKSR